MRVLRHVRFSAIRIGGVLSVTVLYARSITWQRLGYIRSRSLYFVSLCVCRGPQQTVSRKFQLEAKRDAGISGPAFFFLIGLKKTLRFGSVVGSPKAKFRSPKASEVTARQMIKVRTRTPWR